LPEIAAIAVEGAGAVVSAAAAVRVIRANVELAAVVCACWGLRAVGVSDVAGGIADAGGAALRGDVCPRAGAAASAAVVDVAGLIGLVCQDAVAVGVDVAAVGGARRGGDRVLADNGAADAGLGACFAGRRGACGGRRRDVAGADRVARRIAAGFVDHAVAIVVFAVAGLGLGVDLTDADEGAVLALLCAEGAGEDVAGAAGFSSVGGAIVDDAVAIVVLVVADLGDLILDDDVGPSADDFVALADGLADVRGGVALAVVVAVAIEAELRVAGEIVGLVDLAVAVVVFAIAADLDAGDVALVFAARGVGAVEVVEARLAREDLALRIRVGASFAGAAGALAFGGAVEDDAGAPALTAIGDAGAEIDVLVLDAVAIVVFVVAELVVWRRSDARVFAALYRRVDIVIISGAGALAGAGSFPGIGAGGAGDGVRVCVEQDLVAVVGARAASARRAPIAEVVDLPIAIVVLAVALLDAAIGFYAAAGAAVSAIAAIATRSSAAGAPEEASAFAASAAGAGGARARGGARIAVFPAKGVRGAARGGRGEQTRRGDNPSEF